MGRGQVIKRLLEGAADGDPVAITIITLVVAGVLIYFAYHYMQRQNNAEDELFGSPDHGSFPERDRSE